MDRIRNLSLDQKAKLYYMALLQKGMIDRLPDDPKVAYVRDMMGKMDTMQKISPKVDRSSLEKLSGMKEGDTYEKMAAKGKKRGNLKQGTVRKRLKIKAGDKIPLSKINQAISRIKKMDNPSEKNKKYLKALNLAKTLKTTTNVKEIATELGYLKETTISRGIEVEVMEDSIMINGSRLKGLNIAYVEQAPNRIYRGYLHTDKGQVNLDGGESGLNEFLRAAGAPVDEREYPHNIVEDYFMKYGVEVTTSEFDVS